MRKIKFSGRKRKIFTFIAKHMFYINIITGFHFMMPTNLLGNLSYGALIGIIICGIINNYIINPIT